MKRLDWMVLAAFWLPIMGARLMLGPDWSTALDRSRGLGSHVPGPLEAGEPDRQQGAAVSADQHHGFRVSFPGPFRHHDVVVDGWSVPFLEAHMPAEDRVSLVIDRRLGIELSVEEAERFVPFLADAISVALGYGAHPRGNMTAPCQRPHSRPRRVHEVVAVRPSEHTGEESA